MAENFARVETKYLLTLPQAEAVAAGLQARGFRRLDFGCPRIQSLYYDTPEHLLIRTSLERPAYKEKLRLRAYGEPGALRESYLEIKKKYDGVVYKRRAALSLAEAMEGLARGSLPDRAGQVGREALWMTQRWGLVPAAVIAYDRDAWFHPEDASLRVTFDRNLTFRDRQLDLDSPEEGLPILHDGLRLMEVKTGGTLPLWLVRLMAAQDIRRTHFSKYGAAYLQYIRPGQGAQERSGQTCSTVSFSQGA